MAEDVSLLAANKTAALLANVWQRNLPLVRERLAILHRAASSATARTMSRESREEAAATAHKLAGSLGMFGYKHGTEIAREIEQMLDRPGDPDPQLLTSLVMDLDRSLPL